MSYEKERDLTSREVRQREREKIDEQERRRKRSSREIARSVRNLDHDDKHSRYDIAFDFVLQLLRERQPRTQINEQKVDRLRRDYNVDRIVRMLLKSKDFDGNLSVEQFAQLFDRWILPRIASGSFIRSAERRALTKGWKFDDFLAKHEGKKANDIYFMNDIDQMFGHLFNVLKEKYPQIKTMSIEPIRIRSYDGKKAAADAHMTVFTDKGVKDFSGSDESSEPGEHTGLMEDLVRGIRELTKLDLTDKTVDLSTQHEAKFRAINKMLEEADQYFKKSSGQEGGSNEAQGASAKGEKGKSSSGGTSTGSGGGNKEKRAA